jgi:hypothetical protein
MSDNPERMFGTPRHATAAEAWQEITNCVLHQQRLRVHSVISDVTRTNPNQIIFRTNNAIETLNRHSRSAFLNQQSVIDLGEEFDAEDLRMQLHDRHTRRRVENLTWRILTALFDRYVRHPWVIENHYTDVVERVMFETPTMATITARYGDFWDPSDMSITAYERGLIYFYFCSTDLAE